MPRIPVLSVGALLALASSAAAQNQGYEQQIPEQQWGGQQIPEQPGSGQTYGGQTYGNPYPGWNNPFDNEETQNAFARWVDEHGGSSDPLVDSIPAEHVRNAGLVVQARYIPAAPPRDSTLPSTTHYLAQIRHDELAIATDPASFVFGTLASRRAPRHPHGEDFRVRSCAGYVYKRWYEYSRFEDAARTCGTDAMCVFEVGTMWSSPGIASRHQLFQKAPGIAFIPGVLTPRSADPVDGITPIALDVKNAFFAVRPADILRASSRYELDASFAAEAEDLIEAAGTPPMHDLSDKIHWHVTQHEAQADLGLSRVERKDIKFRLDRYQRLVEEYRRLRALLPADEDTIVDLGGGLDDADLGGAGWDSMVSFLGGAAEAGPIPIEPIAPSDGGLAPEIVAAIAYQDVVDEMAKLLMAEWRHVDPEDTVTVDHGCLINNSCDWLPEQFAYDYIGRFQQEREHDMQRCLQATSDVFPGASTADTADDAPWAADVVTMTAHIDARIDALAALVATLPFDGDTAAEAATGSRTIRWGIEPVHESKGIEDLLHGEYKHHAFAELGMKFQDSKVCRMSAKVDAGVLAKFTAPNPDLHYYPEEHVLLDGSLLLLVAREDKAFEAKAHLLVADQELVNFDASIPLSGGSWAAPPKETHFAIYDYGLHFTILGIPAYLSVSVQGDLAFAPRITVPAFDETCTNDLVGHPEILPMIEARIDSNLNVDADGRLAIGVPGFSFGVNGHVDVLTASLPATARFRVVEEDGVPSLSLETDARLDATLLAGGISVYAEALFLYAEQAIFGWDGIAVGFDLWKTKVSVPLTFLRTAFQPPATAGGGS